MSVGVPVTSEYATDASTQALPLYLSTSPLVAAVIVTSDRLLTAKLTVPT